MNSHWSKYRFNFGCQIGCQIPSVYYPLPMNHRILMPCFYIISRFNIKCALLFNLRYFSMIQLKQIS